MSKDLAKIGLIIIFLLTVLFLPRAILAPRNSQEVKEKKQTENRVEIKEKTAKETNEEKIYLLGKFDPVEREDFVLVPLKYTNYRNKIYLRKETYYAFFDMQMAALEDKVDLKISSATRNFDYQKNLWEGKWQGATIVDGQNLTESIPDGLKRFKKILEYSAAPGTSRHHWGTDIDINSAEPRYFNSEKGAKEYDWLVQNASIFGFCQTYNQIGNRLSGYNEEKWHWSYLPIARELTQDYKNLITKDNIKGFNGEEYAEQIDLINDYVLSINPECLQEDSSRQSQ